MVYLKQSTAVTLLVGPFVDSTNGDTAETALTITQADVRLSKNGGNMAQKNETTSLVHDELGYYTCLLDATDTATLGILKIMVHESGALPVWEEAMVVTANVWDTLCSTDQLDVNVTNVAGTSQTANDNGADINAILVTTSSIGTAADLVDAIYEEPTANQITASSFGVAIKDILADTGTDGVELTANAVDDILDEVIEGTTTLREALRLALSVLTGKSSGGGTATLVFRDIGDTKNRLSVTVDANGNRTAVATRDGA